MPLTLAEARNYLNFKLKPWQTENEAFQPNDISLVVMEAVEAYSRVKPIQTIESLSLTAGQSAYNFPSGALQVQPCFFTDEEYNGGILPWDAESPAGWYRNLINQRLAANFWLQRVEVDELQQKIVFYPTPEVTTTGKIIVDRYHALNEEGTTYETIPEKDKPFILKYAEAELLKLLARAYSLNSNDIGDRKNRGLNLASYLDEQAKKLQDEFHGRFKMPVVDRS